MGFFIANSMVFGTDPSDQEGQPRFIGIELAQGCLSKTKGDSYRNHPSFFGFANFSRGELELIRLEILKKCQVKKKAKQQKDRNGSNMDQFG